MDWDMAIRRNSAALKRVLATLVGMAGLDEEPHPEVRSEPRMTLPRRVHLAILRLLRPAEAAARRLIIIVARDMVVTLQPPRPPKPKPKSIYVKNGAGTGIVLPKGYRPPDAKTAPRTYSFSVTDPMRRLSRFRQPKPAGVPRLWIPGSGPRDPVPRPPSPDDEIDASRLVQRLKALASVLDDPQSHAKRFARWRARSKARRIRRTWPLRPGNPPGLSLANRRRPKHEIHGVLWDIHGLAYEILDSPDTS